MPNVLFLSPHYPPEMQDFTRGLAEVGAKVIGVGDTPQNHLPPRVRKYLHGYLQIPGFHDENAAIATLLPALQSLKIHVVESLWEPCVILAARLRELLGLEGMDVDTSTGFRDKAIMKSRLLTANLRVPRFARVRTAKEVREAIEAIGFPIVIKPIAGAGTADTYKISHAQELETVLARMSHVQEANVEEFIEGDEFTYDTVCINGVPVFENVAQYFPKPLESRTQEWISPGQIVYRNPYDPELMPGVELGRKVLQTLGMKTGFTHMEWFKKPNGEAVFGEIAARSPGGKLVDQMNVSNDFDIFREWARAVCWQSFDNQPQRRYHVAGVFKRAQGQGRIQRIEGLQELRHGCGSNLVLEELLPIGHPRRNWKQTLLSDGYVMMRHPQLGPCLEMMKLAIRCLRVYAG